MRLVIAEGILKDVRKKYFDFDIKIYLSNIFSIKHNTKMVTKKIVKGFNLTHIIKKEHQGKWVALSSDYKKVVAASTDIARLEKKVGDRDVVYIRAVGGVLDAGYSF
jgi:hypothetical protein